MQKSDSPQAGNSVRIVKNVQGMSKVDELAKTVHDLPPTDKTPTKSNSKSDDNTKRVYEVEAVFPSSINVSREALSRMTRTYPTTEVLVVTKDSSGTLNVTYKYSFKADQEVKQNCVACHRKIELDEMVLFPPLNKDRRRQWFMLLGIRQKDSVGGVNIAYKLPICVHHFSEECLATFNFNQAAIEAFGMPTSLGSNPNIKMTPTKKRMPWSCTLCEYKSCSVVRLQVHLMEHVAKDDSSKTPANGIMCPFCRSSTYGYKTLKGFQRHIDAGPANHFHLKKILETAQLNFRGYLLESNSWEKWTRRNVYMAYHGCEPPSNEEVIYVNERSAAKANRSQEKQPEDDLAERRKRAVRALGFGDEPANLERVANSQVSLYNELRNRSASPPPPSQPETMKVVEPESAITSLSPKTSTEEVRKEPVEGPNTKKLDEAIRKIISARTADFRKLQKKKKDGQETKKMESRSLTTSPQKKRTETPSQTIGTPLRKSPRNIRKSTEPSKIYAITEGIVMPDNSCRPIKKPKIEDDSPRKLTPRSLIAQQYVNGSIHKRNYDNFRVMPLPKEEPKTEEAVEQKIPVTRKEPAERFVPLIMRKKKVPTASIAPPLATEQIAEQVPEPEIIIEVEDHTEAESSQGTTEEPRTLMDALRAGPSTVIEKELFTRSLFGLSKDGRLSKGKFYMRQLEAAKNRQNLFGDI